MALITRSNAEALIPEDFRPEIIKNMTEQSAVLRLAKRLPNMTTNQVRMPVLSALPMAYFLNPGAAHSDINKKKTTNAEWQNKYINAEEIACIVPIPEAVLDDTNRDIWSEIRPLIEEAIGVVVDQAILFGTNAPTAWPDDLDTASTDAGNVVALGAMGDLYADLLEENGLVSLLEQDGYFPNGYIGAMIMRGRLRGVRDDNGALIFTPSMQGTNTYALDGSPIEFPTSGVMDTSQVLLFAGQWDKLVYAIRQDITYKVLSEAVIQDPDTGDIAYNLAQQDMVALRVTFRMGWQVPNPINREQQTEADRYPFGVLTPVSPS